MLYSTLMMRFVRNAWNKLWSLRDINVPHKNSFNLLRLVAAGMVVLSHSYAIAGHPEPHIGSVNLGAVGVWIFFILSGYLISASWHQYPRFNVFMSKRILRIFPGLGAMLIITVIAGAFLTSLPPMDYLSNPSIISYFNNLFLYQLQFSLPGVFEGNPYPNVVNGSLWTLPYEFTMYLILGVIGATGFYKKISIKTIWLSLLLASVAVYGIFHRPPDFHLFYLGLPSFLPLALMFFTGVYIQERLDVTKTKPLWGVVALIAFLLGCSVIPFLAPVFAATFLAYAVFALGSLPYGAWLQKYGDYSYGIYIYAFPVQQALEQITQTQSTKKIFLASFLISGMLGALSWFIVEEPALKLKRKIKNERYPITQTDEAW